MSDRTGASEADLPAAVDAADRSASRGLVGWPDPHSGRSPLDEEYSRLTDPGRWRIVGVRADAWLMALSEAGVATVRRNDDVDWEGPTGPVISRCDRVLPRVPGALSLVIARSWLGDVDDAGVVLGIGEPAIEIARFPDCGCDACDSGSQNEIDTLDAHLLGIVSGRFRRLSRRDEVVMTIGDGGWSASGRRRPPRAEAVLADPRGWVERSGPSWFST